MTGKMVVPVVQAFGVTDRDFAVALSTATPSDGALVFAWELLRDQQEIEAQLRGNYSRSS